jgi:hypothetical protein
MFACGSDQTAPAPLPPGSHVLTVQGTDAFGNVGPEATKAFVVDTTKPVFTTFDGPSPTVAGTSPPTVTFTFSALDDSGLAAGLSCTMDNVAQPGACSSPRTLTRLSYGPHTFAVTATDDVGNAETTTRTFDVTPVYTGQAAEIVIGQPDFVTALDPAPTDARHFGAPTTVACPLLWVSDSTSHRVLRFAPTSSYPSAEEVLGQSDLTSSMPAVTQNRLLNVVRVSSAPNTTWLSATDVSAHRVLLFSTTSFSSGGPASRVLGQPDFTSSSAGAMAGQLNFPRGAYIDESRVMIADQFNHRVSIWTTFPATNGASADLALGTSSPDVAGVPDPVSASTLRQPSSVLFGLDDVYVGDTGNHRVLIWNGLPTSNSATALALMNLLLPLAA